MKKETLEKAKALLESIRMADLYIESASEVDVKEGCMLYFILKNSEQRRVFIDAITAEEIRGLILSHYKEERERLQKEFDEL